MGNANCYLDNRSGHDIVVVTYNFSDHINGSLIKNRYVIKNGVRRRITAAADVRSLKYGIVLNVPGSTGARERVAAGDAPAYDDVGFVAHLDLCKQIIPSSHSLKMM